MARTKFKRVNQKANSVHELISHEYDISRLIRAEKREKEKKKKKAKDFFINVFVFRLNFVTTNICNVAKTANLHRNKILNAS